jgi:hypothetical protein
MIKDIEVRITEIIMIGAQPEDPIRSQENEPLGTVQTKAASQTLCKAFLK